MFDHIPSAPGIYAIVNTSNGHRYVGQATDMRARAHKHVRDLDRGTHRTNAERRLQEAWLQFGPAAFEIIVLELVPDNRKATNYHERPDNLSLAEHWYINERSEYNVDKRIVRDEFRALVDGKAWRAEASVREFASDIVGAGNAEFRRWLTDNPDGYFVNLAGPGRGMLHRGRCPHMKGGPDDPTNLVTRPKWASGDRRELEARARREARVLSRCADCDV